MDFVVNATDLVDLSKAIDQLFIQKEAFVKRNPELTHLTANDYKPYVYKATGEAEFMFFGRNIDLDLLRYYYNYNTQEYIPTSNITEDVNTRDFTVNCLYYDYRRKRLLDPAHALEDLESNTLRFIFHRNSFYVNPFTVYRMIKMLVKYKMHPDQELRDNMADPVFQRTYVKDKT
jgi:tRNA nucleotidyltransferase/poly(A) polymerase